MLRRIVMAVLVGLLTAGTMSGARAQQPASAGQLPANPSGWTFNVAPYAWFATINTNLSFNLPPALGGTVSADLSVGSGELLSHLNFAAMVAADARYDRFSVLTDFMHRTWAAPLPISGPSTSRVIRPFRSRAPCKPAPA